MISAQALKQEFDAPAKEIVAPKFNGLVDELEATTAAASIGVVTPTGRTGNTVQALFNNISADIGEAVAEAHTHDNKALLDTYDQTNSDIADAVSKAHEHSNKALLDTYTQTESDLSDAVSKKHSHTNKDLLDTYTQTESNLADAVSQKHSHSNKSLLDTYTQPESDLADAVSKKHSHSNKTVLDKFGESSGQPTYDGDPISGVVPTITMTATADAISSDNPTVTVTKTGTDEEPNFALAFSGLKGAEGATGQRGSGILTFSGYFVVLDPPVTIEGKTYYYEVSQSVILAEHPEITSVNVGDVIEAQGKLYGVGYKTASSNPALYLPRPEAIVGNWDDITNKPNFATVATSGSYNDMSNKPTIPADMYKSVKVGSTTLVADGADTLELKAGSNVTLTPDASDNSVVISASGGGSSTGDMLAADYDSSYTVKNAGGITDYVTGQINALDGSVSGTAGTGKTLSAFSQTNGVVSATFSDISITKSQVSDFPTLATVATSGSYNDLSNKPTIPQGDMLASVYDSTSAVATAGGIVAYIDATITAALTASY